MLMHFGFILVADACCRGVDADDSCDQKVLHVTCSQLCSVVVCAIFFASAERASAPWVKLSISVRRGANVVSSSDAMCFAWLSQIRECSLHSQFHGTGAVGQIWHRAVATEVNNDHFKTNMHFLGVMQAVGFD